jgi:hypothetical protein
LNTPITLDGEILRDADGGVLEIAAVVCLANASAELAKQLKQEYEVHRSGRHVAVMCFRCAGM